MLLSKRERTLKSVYFCTRIAHDCFSRDYKHKQVEHFSRQKIVFVGQFVTHTWVTLTSSKKGKQMQMNALNQKRIKLNTRFKVSQQRRKSNFSIDLLWAHFDSERGLKTAFWKEKKKDKSRGGLKKNKNKQQRSIFFHEIVRKFLTKITKQTKLLEYVFIE